MNIQTTKIHKRFLQAIDPFATSNSKIDITNLDDDAAIQIDSSITSFCLVEADYDSEEQFQDSPYDVESITFSPTYFLGQQYLDEKVAQELSETHMAKHVMQEYPDAITAIQLTDGVICAFCSNNIYVPFPSDKYEFSLNELANRINDFKTNKSNYTVPKLNIKPVRLG